MSAARALAPSPQPRPDRVRVRVRVARRRGIAALAATVAVGGLLATLAVAPLPRPSIAVADSTVAALSPFSSSAQQVTVAGDIAPAGVSREGYSAATGPETLVASGTNYDWAELVLVFGGWPTTDENIRLMVEWMREENGPDNWWNRNNPLNNGYGSGGGGGTGSYANLVIAAQMAAENLSRGSGYVHIVAAIAASSPTAVTESAIWASPWASGHYANGAHWHYFEVPKVTAPPSAWG